MNLKPVIVGALVFAAVRAGQKLKAVREFSYSLIGLPSITLQGSLALISVSILITNLTKERFNIKKIYGTITVNGQPIGDLQSISPVLINGFGSASVTISVATEITNAILSLIRTVAANSGALTIAVAGAVVTDTITVPMVVSKKIR